MRLMKYCVIFLISTALPSYAYALPEKYTTAETLLKSARSGDALSQVFLGDMYFNGAGVKRNISEARKWYRMAAEQGDPDAIAKLKLLDKGYSPTNLSENPPSANNSAVNEKSKLIHKSLASANEDYRTAGLREREKEYRQLSNKKAKSNPLYQRGFYQAFLLYSDNKIDVYHGLIGPKMIGPAPSWKKNTYKHDISRLIFVHKISSSQEIIDKSDGLKNYQKIFDSINITGINISRTHHYVSGFHHPVDDMNLVRGRGRPETPLAVIRFALNSNQQLVEMERIPSYLGSQRVLGLEITSPSVKSVNSVAETIREFGSKPYVNPEPRLRELGNANDFYKQDSEIRRDAIARGHVYKNEAYWNGFKSPTLRQIFDGTTPNLDKNSPQIIEAAQAFWRNKYSSCRNEIRSPYVKFTRHSVQIDSAGNNINREKTPSETIWIDKRFAEYYEYYNDEYDRWKNTSQSEALTSALSIALNPKKAMEDMSRLIKIAEDTRYDVQRIFTLESCASPVLRQLEENLYRELSNKASVQASGFRISGASTASDSVQANPSNINLMYACEAIVNFNPLQKNNCECITSTLGRNQFTKKQEDYRRDFNIFWYDMKVGLLDYYRGADTPESVMEERIRETCEEYVDSDWAKIPSLYEP